MKTKQEIAIEFQPPAEKVSNKDGQNVFRLNQGVMKGNVRKINP